MGFCGHLVIELKENVDEVFTNRSMRIQLNVDTLFSDSNFKRRKHRLLHPVQHSISYLNIFTFKSSLLRRYLSLNCMLRFFMVGSLDLCKNIKFSQICLSYKN